MADVVTLGIAARHGASNGFWQFSMYAVSLCVPCLWLRYLT